MKSYFWSDHCFLVKTGPHSHDYSTWSAGVSPLKEECPFREEMPLKEELNDFAY